MPRLNEAQRNNAIGRLQCGVSFSAVARNFNVAPSTITRLWYRYQRQGSTRDLPRSGRPRVTTRAQDRYIRLRHLRDRITTATSTAHAVPGMHRISAQTIRNRLREGGLRARRPLRGVVLTARHRHQRRQWCQTHRVWNRLRWRRVWFSDESRFVLHHAEGRTRVYRRRERFAPCCIREVNRFGGGSVMMWAAISHSGRSQLVHVEGNLNARRYCDQILEPHILPIMQDPTQCFQHDNARPHSARLTAAYLQANDIDVLPWPSRSPDLNPIEHLWDELDRRVRRQQNQPQSLQQLRRALQEEWNNIPQALVQNLVASMGRRCQAVLDAKGGHTQY